MPGKAADLAYCEYSMRRWVNHKTIDEVFPATRMNIYCCLGLNQRNCERRDVGESTQIRTGSDAGTGDMHSGFPNDARSDLEPQPRGNAAGRE